MRRIITIVVMTAALFAGASPFALAGNDAEEIVEQLQKKYEGIRDAAIVFTQTIRFGVTKAEQTFRGTLYMKKGNRYRVELDERTIVTDGKTVWSYSAVNNQVLIDRYKEDANSISPDKMLVNIPDTYTASFLGEENLGKRRTKIVKLLPKKTRSGIKSMKVWIDDDQWLMRKVQIIDVSDNETTYLVETFTFNKGLSDSTFQFIPPDGADVVDMR